MENMAGFCQQLLTAVNGLTAEIQELRRETAAIKSSVEAVERSHQKIQTTFFPLAGKISHVTGQPHLRIGPVGLPLRCIRDLEKANKWLIESEGTAERTNLVSIIMFFR
jgi:hypothetical protein